MAASHHGQGNSHSSEPTHFFKVLLPSTIQDDKLMLPSKFARIHGNALSSPVSVKIPNGQVWEMELRKCNNKIWFQHGWETFTKQYSLDIGHFLVFRYEGNCHFHVFIFDRTATEIDYPYFKNNEDIQPEEVKIEQSEDDDSIQITSNISSGKRTNPEPQCPRPHKVMRTNSGDKTERSLKFESVAKQHGKDTGLSAAGKGNLKSTRVCRVQKLNSVEKCKALQRVSRVFKTENPYFLVVMQPAYVAPSRIYNFFMDIPQEFARKHLNDDGDVALCDSNGKTWSAGYYSFLTSNKQTHGKLCRGWGSFVADNKLQVGDVCAFELIDCTKISLKVSIFRAKEVDFHVLGAFTDDSSHSKRKPGNLSTHWGGLGALKVCNTADERLKKSSEEALQRAKAFTSENPFFIAVLQPSYVHKSHALSIPYGFSRKYFKCDLTSVDVVLCLPNGKSWPAEYHQRSIGRPDGKICSGWRAFVNENELEVGDVCVLEMTDNNNISFKVFVFKAISDANCQPSQGVVRSNTVCGKQQMKLDEKSQALQRATAAFKSENPFFMVFIEPTYVDVALASSHAYSIAIPEKFAKKYLMNHVDVILCDANGKTWAAEYCYTSGNNKESYIELCNGWGPFVRDNNIQVGDVCAFELINSTEITFKVFICRAEEVAHGSQAFINASCPAKRDAGTSFSHLECKESLMTCEAALVGAKKASEKALQKAQAFTSENPFFHVVLQPSYVLGRHNLYIPKEFSRKHFKSTLTSFDIVLCLPNGKSWSARYHQRSSGRPNGRISIGWRKFCTENKLEVGDVCIFEMTNNNQVSFKVLIFKAIEDANSKPSQGVTQEPLGFTPESPKSLLKKKPQFVLPIQVKEKCVNNNTI